MTKQTDTKQNQSSDAVTTNSLDEFLGPSRQQYLQLSYHSLRPLAEQAKTKNHRPTFSWPRRIALFATIFVAVIGILLVWNEPSNRTPSLPLASLSMPDRPVVSIRSAFLSQARKANRRLALPSVNKKNQIRFRLPKRPHISKSASKPSTSAKYKQSAGDLPV